MRSRLTVLLARATRWLEGSVAQTAAAFAAVTAGAVLAASAISFWYARDLARAKELAAMQISTEDEAERIADQLGEFSALIASLAADEAVAAAVVDSEGRNRHLAPVLRLLQPTLERQFSTQAAGGRFVSARVAVLDYRGRPLVASAAAPEGLPPAEWLEAVLRGRPAALLDPRARLLYLARPVVFQATAQGEGIALGVLELSDRTIPSKRSLRWRESLVIGGAASAESASAVSVMRRVPLPAPMEDIPLYLALSIANSSLDAEAAAILRPHLAVAVVGMLLSIFIGIAVARRTTRPLRRLSEAARTLGAGHAGQSLEALAAGGARETVQLGRALDEALRALGESTAAATLAKTALDAASDGVVIVDMRAPDAPVIYANPAHEAITGYPAGEVLGRNPRFLHAQEPTQPALETLRAATRTGQAARVLLRNWRKVGTPFWNELAIAPVRDAGGGVTHYIGFLKDASERIRTEDHVRSAQKLEALGQLTGGLAHDFNNLLGIVIGNLDLLSETLPEDSPDRGRANTALQAALRGADVTRSLLAVARRQHLEPQEVDINERLRDMLPLLRNTLGRCIELRAELSQEPLHALVDVSGVDTAVLNFTINARDAMSEAGGELRLRTRELALPGTPPEPEFADLAPGRYVAIEVIDNGSGMPEAVRARAFEPFFTTKPTGRGTGLGLSMVYGFARQSGGTAVLRDAPGGGTIAALILPASDRGPGG